jgi:glycosyltransferase involved in cell wall biosynthesis
MTSERAAEQDGVIVASGEGTAGDPPAVSVIVPVTGPGSPVSVLESLVAQTLAPSAYEIVLVVVGDADADRAPSGVAGPQVRVCRVSKASPGEARDLGLLAARGRHSLLVGEDDRVSPGLLEALLRRARPGVVPVARPAGASKNDERLLLDGLEAPGGKLVSTRVARSVSHGQGPGTEPAYWLALADREGLEFELAGPDASLTTRAVDDVLQRVAVIGRLREIAPTSPGARALAERLVVHQAEAIRRHLLEHPDRHGDVVARARELEIGELPWAVVNRGRARHLALLYLFTPFLDTSALVAARRLRERGLVTDVVSQDISNLRSQDAASDLVAAEVVDEQRMLPGELTVADWSSVETFAEQALAQVGELQARKGPYESVYSRATAAHSHFAAAVLKLRTPGLRWVAEFSDPQTLNALGETRHGEVRPGWLTAELASGLRRAGHAVPGEDASFYEWAERLAYAFADDIVFTNQHQLDLMLGYCADRALAERARAISRVSHHPVPTPDLYRAVRSGYALSPDKVHIGYFGNFYLNRGLTEVTGALDALSAAERDRVQLHVFTAHPEPLVLQTLEHGLADVITVNPLLGFLKYLNLTTRFDVLLITDYATRPHFVPNPFLPAKLADYRGSGATIWAVHEPGSVLSQLPVDYASELGDVASATMVLRTLASSARVRSLA